MSEQTKDFSETGAFKINNQYATGVRYEVEQDKDEISSGTIAFINGRKQVAKETISSREQLTELLGEENVKNILDNKGASKGTGAEKLKGKLQGEDLHFKEAQTKDFSTENVIEAGTEREQDPRLQEFLKIQREDMRRIRKEVQTPGFERDRDDLEKPENITLDNGTQKPKQSASDKDKAAIPANIASRYIQVENKYHYPDQSLAFEDKGSRLSTRSTNSQLIKDMVGIAEAREWDTLRVRGSEEFRRAAWMEASQRGLEVTGYKPSEIEKAHLISILQKQGKEVPEPAGRSNSIEQGRSRDQQADNERVTTAETASADRSTNQGKTFDASKKVEPTQGTESGEPAKRKGVHRGVLLEHGADFYNHDKQESESYYVRIKTDRGNRELWGQDLERAVNESGAKAGDKIDLEFKGKEPVKLTVDVKDKDGQVIGSKEIEGHRSTWAVEKVQSFNQDKREEAVKKHPELTAAYVTMAAAEKFAAKQWPNDKDMQQQFTSTVKETLSQKMEQGDRVPTPAVMKTKQQEATQENMTEKAKTINQDKELSR